MSIENTDVLIIGAGPAGLAAGIALKRRGVQRVLVVEREDAPGGTPRLCHHTGFGLRDLRGVYSGPDYAQAYVRRAEAAGLEVRTATTITGWQGPTTLAYTSPRGVGAVAARAILLATGCRERPRAARLVPGRRPQGVFTTGSLQRFVYQHGLPVGRRAVIVGAELVSLSALMTLRHAGATTAAMVTDLPRHQIYFPYLAAKWWFADLAARVPVLTGARVSNLLGGQRLEAVEVTHLATGQRETVPCDLVVFTGDWIPEHLLARLGGLEMDPGTHGPRVDGGFHTSLPGVFAAGNLLRGAETADACALEGAYAATALHGFLEDGRWPGAGVAVQAAAPITWVYPNRAGAGPQTGEVYFRVARFCAGARVTVWQGERELFGQTYRQLAPNDTARMRGDWRRLVNPAGGPVQVSLQGG